jgi:hypothetical protein
LIYRVKSRNVPGKINLDISGVTFQVWLCEREN